MINTKTLIGSAALALAMTIGSFAQAAVFKFTEGNRAIIDGSVVVTPDGDGGNDTSGAPPGFVLSSLGAGDSIELHGRVGQIQDRYTFTSSAAFSLTWIFDGYMVGGALVAADTSGFSGIPAPGPGDNTSRFTLTNLGTLAAVSDEFTTDINGTTGDPEQLFPQKFAAGTYELLIEGFGPRRALYDLEISAVPLPAGALLLLTGMGGIALARRRKKA